MFYWLPQRVAPYKREGTDWSIMKLNQVSMKHLDMCNNDREEKHDFLAGNLNGISSKVMKN